MIDINIPDDLSAIAKKPHSPWWRRWLKRVGKGLLVAAILISCRVAWRHYQVTNKLNEAMTELDRAEPGWRLKEIEAAREQIPEDENSARVVVAVSKLLPKKWPTPEFYERFAHLPPEEQLIPNDFARLKQELENVRPALREAHKLAKMPRGRHRIEYKRNVLVTRLTDQAEARRIVWLLILDALRHDQNDDLFDALGCCRAAFNSGRSLGDEPLPMSQLVRTSCVSSACQGVERVLAQGELPTEALADFGDLLQHEDAFTDLLVIARGERACDQEIFDAVENGDILIGQLAGGPGNPSWPERLSGFISRDFVREEHPTMLALMSRWVAIAAIPSWEQKTAERRFDQAIRDVPKTTVLTRLLLPALTKLGEVSRHKHACLRCLTVALAAERYRQANNGWPDSFDKLCPQYLPEVLLDPFDGKPLRYRRVEDGIVIYSVSSDGVDNNGNIDREHPNQAGADIGCRLWDVAKRRQTPRPKPLPDSE